MGASTDGAALRHLTGAGNLLNQWLSSHAPGHAHPLDGFLIETYFYFTTLSSLSFGHEKARQIFDETSTLLSDMRFTSSAEFGHLCGDTHRLFVCIPRIGGLTDYLASGSQDASSREVRAREEYHEIHRALTEWRSSEPVDTPFSICAEIYREALFLYLSMSSHRAPSLDEEEGGIERALKGHFDKALRYLDNLGPDEPASTILNFPLAVLGCYARGAEQRFRIRKRLIQQYEQDGMNNFRVVVDLLDKFWDEGTHRGRDEAINTFRTLSRSVLIG